jgi:RimJ/RimL family protein N-acetyltransferase
MRLNSARKVRFRAARGVMPRIETARLVLRVPRLDDANAFADYLADPEVMRFLGGETVPRDEVASVLGRWLGRWQANGVGPFAIERRDDGRVIGRAGIIVWDTGDWRNSTWADAGDDAQPELGWALGRAHWGFGYATEAALAVREWARRERGVGRLISLINPDNVRSQRVAERLGATRAETITLFDSGPAVVWVHPR